MVIIIMVIHGKKSGIVTSISNNQWLAAKVVNVTQESLNAKTYSFELPQGAHHIAGQHYELRLTAENGYQAARPYSAASTAHHMPLLELTIERVTNGEVSTYVYDSLQVGDMVEIRGPFGKFFIWTSTITDPVLLIGGGSGIVPLHAMFTSHAASNSTAKMHLLYSARSYENILYKDELLDSAKATITLTQDHPPDWQGEVGRIDKQLIKETLDSYVTLPLCYICGMSSFVGSISDILQEFQVPTDNIKTERFG
jgi:ferredoxin-NADP reductase